MINAFETIQSEAFDASTFEHDAKLQKRAERLAQLSFLVNLVNNLFQTNGLFHKATYNKVWMIHSIY